MLKNLKSKLPKSIKISKFNAIIALSAVLLNGILIGLSMWKYTFRFNTVFLKANVIQIILAFLVCFVIFYLTFEQVLRKKVKFSLVLLFVVLFGFFLFNLSGVTFLFENLLGRASFSTSSSIFINLALIIFGMEMSRFDFPVTDSFLKLYLAIEDSFKKNLGLFIFIFFLVSWIGLVNGTFVYVLSIIPLVLNVYLFKTLLSNSRK